MPKALLDIFSIQSPTQFEHWVWEAYTYQLKNNPVYAAFAKNLKRTDVTDISDIPFLPISFFKSHEIKSFQGSPETIFTSSGTTGAITSKHFVKELSIYEASFLKAFELFYGQPEEFVVLGLLPSYLERSGSSLVYMVDRLIELSKSDLSGTYLYNHEALIANVEKARQQQKKILLIGVSYALMDLADKEIDLSDCIVMETGGMKGKRKELTKAELHAYLCKGLNLTVVHSEYGMTELLSQGYSKGNGVFELPPWMAIKIREVTDPLSEAKPNKAGGINIIDLANFYSCPFLATEDLGKKRNDHQFEIVGRFDHSDVRGCNLMVV